MKFQRMLTKRLVEALEVSPIVLLTGARQTGKTTLVKEIAEARGMNYLSFDDLTYLAAAEKDPIGFLANLPKPLILDEVQRAAQLALPIKLDVDNRNQSGQYILTGSANPLVAPKLNDSLAGRMMILNLWPLSQGELLGCKETFLDNIFHEHWEASSPRGWSRDEMLKALAVGGYPRMQGLSASMRYEWCNSHLTTILERDVQDLAKISRLKELPNLMQLLSLRTANLFNVADVGRAVGIPYTTLTVYLQLLEALFLIIRQPAWHRNKKLTLTKMPKMYFADTGLLCHLLRAEEGTLQANSVLLGPVLENFVVQEIRKQTTWSEQRVKLYHFRTQDGAEVDLVLENGVGDIVGIEVKSSQTITAQDFRGLEVLAQETGEAFVRGLVLYPGNNIVPFGNNMFAVPISALWSA